MNSSVHCETRGAGEFLIGLMTLNAPETLNSLTLEMVDLMQSQLDEWADNEKLAAVFIQGAGEKAFCAGGDVQALHASAVETPGGPCVYAETFFAREYELNYTLHTYAKPLICWGHGIVMGGGLGVMAGCSHRVVTERTRIAMPEITIALFPDVGGSWFLNHAPGRSGEFLALTGASIDASDATFIGLADRFVLDTHRQAVIAALLKADWSPHCEVNNRLVRRILRSFSETCDGRQPAGHVASRIDTINALMDADDIHQIIDQICAVETEDPWLLKARDSLRHGSKLAALWIHRQLRTTRHSSLREVFQSEIRLATQVVRYPEFAEGVRALLIDKDRKPAWQFATSRAVPDDLLDQFFQEPWPTNPLRHLQ